MLVRTVLGFLICGVWATACQGEDSEKPPTDGSAKPQPSTAPTSQPTGTGSSSQSRIGEAKAINCSMNRNEMIQTGTVKLEIGPVTLVAGYSQVSADNQNPVVARFEGETRAWCRDDYETSGDDGKAYGLLWNGATDLFVSFSATGTQGEANADYRRFTQGGWLSSYGNGGGAKVAVILKLDSATGSAVAGTFLRSQKSDGKTNSVEVTDLAFTESSDLQVKSNAWFSPLGSDKRPMTCTGSSPFPYDLVFDANLTQVKQASATGCSLQ